jgi:hypothetical protein
MAASFDVCFWHLADTPAAALDVCFRGQTRHAVQAGQLPTLTQRRSSGLLDDFIRECEHRGRDVEAKSLGSRERR